MTLTNFTTKITVPNPASEVFSAINNVRGWWSEEIEGITDQLHEVWHYHYQDVHRCKMKIIEFVPYKKVVWLVLENYFSFTKDPNEWKGDKIVFEIFEAENTTTLLVIQEGLTSENECYDICENAWNTYIQKSLFSLITTGIGYPNSSEKAQTEDEESLSATNFTTTFFVSQSPEEVFSAINNVRAWWQGEIIGETTRLNDDFTYQMPGHHYSKQRIVELIQNEKIVWKVLDSELKFEKKNEWTGTTILFEIKEINNKTQVRFTHIGLVPEFECYGDCSWAWGELIGESLISLITTGKGKNVFG
jgi:hypothetical protein